MPIQRLALGFNKIRRYDDIRCISKLTSLEEISLEGKRLKEMSLEDCNRWRWILGNPLAFTKAYEQIILSQSQSSTTGKQDLRQPMNIVNEKKP